LERVALDVFRARNLAERGNQVGALHGALRFGA
jgi:hypothetical protein